MLIGVRFEMVRNSFVVIVVFSIVICRLMKLIVVFINFLIN